ncbi:Baseplate protein (plasmid) [Rhodovastum atsumiense]|uniref:Baseplate protein n=1 Tax=Rhodovastum atsumiense TaxID=504468 RepID=A0A5M6IN13_9PROT|nr:baseplate J/gp47 family protein [Rhodovastum atsumiense]KAA5609644.1 baseplate protein [Rhodovastum atsumiense]CAH2606510.1 Baseplate protein [Rhodovastum atsumiense]
MATLSLRTFADWLSQQAAAVQASASSLLNVASGTVLRAILEANASVALWMQWLILLVLRTTRLSTSTGDDADSFVADFGLERQAATAATGSVTFSAFTAPTSAVAISTGTVVKTGDGSVSFATTAGATLAAGATSVTVPVQAQTAGTVGNVLAGTITLISAALPGVDTVTNATAFTNGEDAETDAALRTRFINYINTRSRATPAAVEYAVTSVQQGLFVQLAERVDGSGAARDAHTTVYVDDGSGSPSADLIDSVAAAVEAVRPLGGTYEVHGPTVVPANVALTVTAASGYAHGDLVGPVQTAIAAYIDGLGMGEALSWTRLIAVAYGVDGVGGVSGLTVNGGTANIGGAAGSVVRVSTVTVS